MKSETIKEVMSNNAHLFNYGCVIHEDTFCTLFGISKTTSVEFMDMISNASKSAVKELLNTEVLSELSVADVVKTELRKTGKHMAKVGQVYRVYLPSENEAVAVKYKKKAARANAKAKLLLSNTPKECSQAFNTMNPFTA